MSDPVTDADADADSGSEPRSEGMGVSSERVGHAGPGQEATHGVRDNSAREPDADADTPPEQTEGGAEDNPDGRPPKAGYSSTDPRSDDET